MLKAVSKLIKAYVCIPAAKDGSFALDKKEKEVERFFPQRETVSPYLVATTRLGPRRFDHHCMRVHFPSCLLRQQELEARKCDRRHTLRDAEADLQDALSAADL